MDEFERLLAGNRLGVERWVKFHVPGPDAEDILQEAYLAAFQAFPRLQDKAAFRPWLLSIARNKWRDWYRKQARRPDTPVGELPEVAAEEAKMIRIRIKTRIKTRIKIRTRIRIRTKTRIRTTRTRISPVLNSPVR